MTARTYWNRLKKTGWLNYVPVSRHKELRKGLADNFKMDPEWAYLALSEAWFDTESFDDVGSETSLSYHSKLLELATDSGGVFSPTHVKDEYVEHNRKIRLSFRVGRKRYSCTVEATGWFDNRVLDLINEAIAATGAEQRFIALPAVDQFLNLVFVPPSVYEAAVERGLIPSESPDDD